MLKLPNSNVRLTRTACRKRAQALSLSGAGAEQPNRDQREDSSADQHHDHRGLHLPVSVFSLCCPIGRRRSFNPGSSPTSCICRLLARSPSCPSSFFASGHIVLMLGGLSDFWSNTATNALWICLVVACLSGGAAISTCLSGPDLIFAPAPVTSGTR